MGRNIRAMAAVVAVVGMMVPAVAIGAAGPAAATAACDDVLIPGSAWMRGTGVDIRSNGPNTGSAVSCRPFTTDLQRDVPQWGLGWQCVELVNRLYMTRGWITSTWQGNGGDMYNTAPANLAKDPQGSIRSLSLGDVVVFGSELGPGYGHAAVV